MAAHRGSPTLPACPWIFVVLALLPVSQSLKLVHLDVPSSVQLNDSVWLNCSLDLEGVQLYSVKWYKNGEEFYRYLPRDKTPVQSYQLPGVYINENTSGEGHVFLQKTDYNSEGVYRCEASAEAPYFQTVSDEKELQVFVLPMEGPQIIGSLTKYETGDKVNISCLSAKSYPPAVLKWLVNGIEVPPEDVIRHLPVNDTDGLSSTKLDLLFQVDAKHLGNNFLNFRCESVVSQRFSMSTEEKMTTDHSSAEQDQTKHKPSGAPVITNEQDKYKIGDVLHVNCTSAVSVSPTELKWFVNNKQADPKSLLPGTTEDGTRPTLGLKFLVNQSHFDEGGDMLLKCTSTLSKVLNVQADERRVEGSHRKLSAESPKVRADMNSTSAFPHVPEVLVLLVVSVCLITC